MSLGTTKEIIDKLDEADQLIRNRLKLESLSLGERNRLESVRVKIQEGLTLILFYG